MKNTITAKLKPTAQEHSMGCAIACVAFRCRISYRLAHALFTHQDAAWARGYYCKEVVEALARKRLNYSYCEFDRRKHTELIKTPGTIVFVEPSSDYPSGHYLIRASRGWMNPWSNFPSMAPVRSNFETKLPGRPSWVIYELVSFRP